LGDSSIFTNILWKHGISSVSKIQNDDEKISNFSSNQNCYSSSLFTLSLF